LAELDKVLAREWNHESGTTMPIMVMGIDTGDRPKPVYDFALRHVQPAYGVAGIKVHAPRSVCPTKGSSTETLRLLAGVSKQDAARKRQGVRIVSIGTAYAKQELFDNLRIPKPLMNMAAPGYCHHPHYGEEYFPGFALKSGSSMTMDRSVTRKSTRETSPWTARSVIGRWRLCSELIDLPIRTGK
jgi:phage terminase large subunit GpA-like protein